MNIEARNFNIFYQDKLLVKNASLSISKGKVTALVGNSGSGKTVLSSALMGVVAKNLSISGELFLNNEPCINSKNLFCAIMQNPRTAFNPLFSIQDCIVETMRARKLTIDKKLIIEELERLGLKSEVLSLYPHQLSGGMLQRVMILIALLSQANFLIADEATSDLDLLSQKAVLEILEGLKNRFGILLITHDFGVVARLADEVLVMSDGEIVEREKVLDIFNNPRSKTVQDLLNAHLKLYGDDIVRAN